MSERVEVLNERPWGQRGRSPHRVPLELLHRELGKVDEEMVHLGGEGALTDVAHAERPVAAAAWRTKAAPEGSSMMGAPQGGDNKAEGCKGLLLLLVHYRCRRAGLRRRT